MLANWIPDPSPDWGANAEPFLVMMVAGFLIGVAGHIVRSKTAVALGIGLIFLATFILPLAIHISKS